MVSKVVFHIGDRTTGGAAIEAALMQATWPPDSPRNGPRVGFANLKNRNGLSAVLSDQDRPKLVQKRFGRLVTRIGRLDEDIAVVADEGFETVEPARLARAIGDHLAQYRERVQVIAYVRPHAARLWAAYASLAGAGGDDVPTPEQFVEDAIAAGEHVYTPRFSAWRAEFGDRFALRPLIGGDVAGDFLDALSGFAGFDCSGVSPGNSPGIPPGIPGLTQGDLALLRAFRQKRTRKPDLRKARAGAARYLAGVLEAMPGPDGARAYFPRAVSERIQAHYSDDARALDQAFFDQPLMQIALAEAVQDSPLGPDTGPDTGPVTGALADHFDAQGQRLAGLWAGLAGDLLARNPDDWQGHFRPSRDDGPKRTGAR